MGYKTISGKKTEQPAKELSNPIAGSLLSAGRSEVIIDSITKEGAKVKVQLVNDFKEIHTGNIFILDRTGTDISYRLKELISAVSAGPQELTRVYDDLGNDDLTSVLAFKGQPVGVELSGTEGYTILRVPDGYEAGGVTCKTPEELRFRMKQQGKVPAYLNISKFYRLEKPNVTGNDIVDEFIGTDTAKTQTNKATNGHRGTSNVGQNKRGPDTKGWL